MPRSLIPRLAILRPQPLRKRLWQGAIALVAIFLSIAAVNQFIDTEKSVTPAMLGHDFLPFYTAGVLVRNDASDLLYDLPIVKAAEHDIGQRAGLDLGKSFGPFWNPPHYAWLFVPFAAMPYREALLCWVLLNVAALMCAIVLMRRMFGPDADWKTTALVPMLILVSMPFVQAISHGQNTFMSLMLVAMCATAWRERRALSAGIACGLLMYKPQLAAVLVIVMTLDLGWRAALGAGAVLSTLLLTSAWSMPGAWGDYLVKLPENLRAMQIESTYLWERHVTFRSFWRLLIQGRSPGETSWLVFGLTGLCSIAIGGALLLATVRSKRRMTDDVFGETRSIRRDRLIAATIASSPLVMPFYFDYDLLLLAVPATLLAVEVNGRAVGADKSRIERALIGIWAIMFCWMTINPGMGAMTRVNGTALLLMAVAGMLLARAMRKPEKIAMCEPSAMDMAVRRIAA